jgi:hypothetical protein
MKTLISVVLLLVTTSAFAWQNNNVFNNNDFNSNGYTGNSGTKYQYDMNNIGDNIRYQSDSGAQIRDRIGGNRPGAKIDRAHGQYGGGVQW